MRPVRIRRPFQSNLDERPKFMTRIDRHFMGVVPLVMALVIGFTAASVHAQQGPLANGVQLQQQQAQPQQQPNQQRATGPEERQPAIVPAQLPQRFHLNAAQDDYLNRVLMAWQTHTEKTKTFQCDFRRWTYNPAFELPQFKDVPLTVCDGDLKYADPDKGTFRITRVMNLDANTGKYEDAKDEPGEHWVCDGESIWEYDHKDKRVIERQIPEQLQGKAIRNTPLPFLFGAQAVQLKHRYFLCIVTPQQFAKTQIWIDAIPRTRADATVFREALLTLDRRNFDPLAMRVYDTGENYQTYEFSKIVINDPLGPLKKLFAPPRIPFGWRKVLELPPEATARRQSP